MKAESKPGQVTELNPSRSSGALVELKSAAIPSFVASDRIVLERVDFVLKEREYWAIGGLSGTGKSDFLAAAAGLSRAAAGDQKLFGKQVSALSEEELVSVRRRTGFVFSEGRLFNGLTVAENVALPFCYHRDFEMSQAEEWLRAVLEAMGLSRWAGERPHQLPRSMHARVGLARALALSPEILFVDNPLAGLDPRQIRWWVRMLAELARGHALLAGRSAAIVVSTDDFRPWLDEAGRFGVLHEREFWTMGSREELMRDRRPAVRDLLVE